MWRSLGERFIREELFVWTTGLLPPGHPLAAHPATPDSARMPDLSSPPEPAQFPDPVLPGRAVEQVRRRRVRDLQWAAWVGVAIRLLVIAIEGAAVWQGGYEAIFVDVIASAFDIGASLAILLAIRLAARPPDDEYPFGHGRFEPLAGLQLGVLLSIAGAVLLGRYSLGLGGTSFEGNISPWIWTVPLLAAILLELASRIVRRSGLRNRSTALLAEAGHYRIDAWTSLLAAIGLGIAALIPAYGKLVDFIAAMVLSALMIVLGWRAAAHNLHQLLDRVPDEHHFDRVRAAAMTVAGVLDVEKVRIQHAGPDAHVDIDIEVEPTMTVHDAHTITQHVRTAIQMEWPFVRDVVVHVEPYYAGDH